MHPLSQFVLKIHSRCDLACDHCYIYQGPDKSWHGRPVGMPAAVARQAAIRIAEYAQAHRLPAVQVILHGGEPLLARPPGLAQVISELQSVMPGSCRLDLSIHTNGVLLDEQTCELFAQRGVKVGISLDGYRAANDRHRRYASGRSSYDKVIAAIGLLRTSRFRDLYAGLLCTIDPANDPLGVYESLIALEPPRIDFLLPHATWDRPPVRAAASGTDYADWLISIYDRWDADGRGVRIRTFDSVISTLSGGYSFTEALGLEPASAAVIEADGSYEQADSLKTAYDGAAATGLDVFRHSIDEVAGHAGIAARQQGLAGLSETCQQCPVVSSCGGGLYAHRYQSETGFQNPSVYCPDLFKMVSHIRSRMGAMDAKTPKRKAATYSLRRAAFEALAAGFGTAADMGQLARAQRDLGRQLLAGTQQAVRRSTAILPPQVAADIDAAWAVLTRIDRQKPQALHRVLAHPYFRVWAVRCLEQLRRLTAAPAAPGQPAPGNAPADLNHLGSLAITAAIHAGLDAIAAAPVTDNAVHLPGLGRLKITKVGSRAACSGRTVISLARGTIAIQADGGRWTLPRRDVLARTPLSIPASNAGPSAEWQPVRLLTAPGLSVALEDSDPYRDCHQWPAAPRLTAAEHEQWQGQFREAWQLIQRDHENYAPAIATSLTTIMPLRPGPEGRDISAAARDAFGAVGAARPTDAATLALLIMHEFQHVKLGAILDQYHLYDLADRRLFHAPWRTDRRPLEGLLQGTYAHLAVTDYWRQRQATASGPAAAEAGQQFTRWLAHTRDSIDTLAASGSLTELGVRFVEQMRRAAR